MSDIKTGNGKDIMVLVYSCIPHKKKKLHSLHQIPIPRSFSLQKV